MGGSQVGQEGRGYVDARAELFADAGEEALQKLTELPGGQKAVTAFNDLRNRVDELGKKVRGIDALEARVTKLEKDLAALKKSSRKSGSESAGD